MHKLKIPTASSKNYTSQKKNSAHRAFLTNQSVIQFIKNTSKTKTEKSIMKTQPSVQQKAWCQLSTYLHSIVTLVNLTKNCGLRTQNSDFCIIFLHLATTIRAKKTICNPIDEEYLQKLLIPTTLRILHHRRKHYDNRRKNCREYTQPYAVWCASNEGFFL